MPKLKLFLLILLVVWNSQKLYSQDTVIVGKAANAKYSAGVITPKGDIYYIEGLKAWSPEQLEKTVKVTGQMVIKRNKKPKKSDKISGRITSPTFIIIRKAAIEIVVFTPLPSLSPDSCLTLDSTPAIRHHG